MAISWSKQFYGIGSEAIIGAINEYYGSNSLLWDRMITGRSSYEEIMTAYDNLPPIDITYALDGHILGIDAKQAINVTDNSNINTLLNSVDSNAQSATYGATKSVVVDIPSNTTVIQPDPQLDPEYGVASGPLSGSGNPIAAIADKASLAVTGTAIGAKLGKAIDQALYDLDPEWWDNNLPTINPETWSSLVGVNPAGDFFLRTFLGVDNTSGGMVSYYNELALAYYYEMMRDTGAIGGSPDSRITGYSPITSGVTLSKDWSSYYPITLYSPSTLITYRTYFGRAVKSERTVVSGNPDYMFQALNSTGNTLRTIYYSRTSSVTVREVLTYMDTGATADTSTSQGSSYNLLINGIRYYYNNFDVTLDPRAPAPSDGGALYTYAGSGNGYSDLCKLVYNNNDVIEGQVVPGITDIPSSTQYPPTNITGTTPQQVLQQLKQEYPDLFDDAITIQTLQDDGTVREDTYIPVPTPDIDSLDMNNPVSGDVTQDNYKISDETLVKIFNDISNKNPTDTDTPDTGTGTGPTVTIPTGNASSLWAVYNPSQSQLNSFGAWLWSSDLVDQIKRLFVDPMQAVIGVHKVFCNVPNGGSATIKCGYIDSGVSAPTVSSQYVQIDCGTVSVNEFYGNVFDYEPYTTIHAYLPFIGVVKLDTGDVMRGSVNITYGVDVITGACLAKIKVSRDGNSGILYSFGGSCAVHYPLSSGSYGGIISGIVSAAVGVGTSVITGNPLAAVGGIISGAHQAHFDVSKSGGFTGASGATGPKKPYLIISRPQTSMARGFDIMTGYPANQLVQIKDCEGYIKCKETHIESNTATQEELNTIETMLKNGILI